MHIALLENLRSEVDSCILGLNESLERANLPNSFAINLTGLFAISGSSGKASGGIFGGF